MRGWTVGIGLCLALVVAAMAAPARADFSACESGYQEQDLREKIRLYTICITKGGIGRADRAGAFVNRGVAHEQLGELDLALADYDASIAEDPTGGWGHLNRGRIHATRREWAAARDDFETAGKLAFKAQIKAAAYVQEAVLLSTCPDPSIRDTAKARELAAKALKLDRGPAPHEAMAAGLAFDGRFEEAIAEQTKAIEIARKQKRPDAAAFEHRLELLRKAQAAAQPSG